MFISVGSYHLLVVKSFMLIGSAIYSIMLQKYSICLNLCGKFLKTFFVWNKNVGIGFFRLLFSCFCVDIFFFLCGQKEETRKNREHAPPSNKWAFRCLAAELAASPLRQSSPETTPKSLICYRRLPLSFAPLTPRLLSWQCEGLPLSFATFRGRCAKGSCYRSPLVGADVRRGLRPERPTST